MKALIPILLVILVATSPVGLAQGVEIQKAPMWWDAVPIEPVVIDWMAILAEYWWLISIGIGLTMGLILSLALVRWSA